MGIPIAGGSRRLWAPETQVMTGTNCATPKWQILASFTAPAGRDWPWLRQVVVDVISSCDAIGEALGANGAEAFSENPLSRPHFASRERPVLLIFDGLDELA